MAKGIDAEIQRVGKFALPIDFLALKMAVDDVGGEFGGVDGGGHATGKHRIEKLSGITQQREMAAVQRFDAGRIAAQI